MENLKLYDFLDQICLDDGKWSRLEIVNYIEYITSGYDLNKLIILKNEIEFFSSCFLESLAEQYGEDKMNEFSSLADVPFRRTETIEYRTAKKNGDPLEGIPRYYPAYIDYEAIFANELFPLKCVEGIVVNKIAEEKSSSSSKPEIKKSTSLLNHSIDGKNKRVAGSNLVLSALETAYLIYYLVESREYIWINSIPGELDWEYFSKITNGKSPTNIRKSYNLISLKKEERLRPSRILKIEKVVTYIQNSLSQYKGALHLAEKELQIIEKKLT